MNKEPIFLCVDFDGTIADTKDCFPKIRKEIKNSINTLLTLKQLGCILILNTCREGENLNDAIKWMKQKGLVFDYVNNNAEYLINKWGNDCRKIAGTFYIDDRNIGSIPSWNEIYNIVKKEIDKQ